MVVSYRTRSHALPLLCRDERGDELLASGVYYQLAALSYHRIIQLLPAQRMYLPSATPLLRFTVFSYYRLALRVAGRRGRCLTGWLVFFVCLYVWQYRCLHAMVPLALHARLDSPLPCLLLVNVCMVPVVCDFL